MKLRLGRSLLGNARFGLVVGLALASGVGCSDDDSVPVLPTEDAGGTESTATGGESSTGGGGNTTEQPTTSDTSAPADTLTVNPDTSTGSPTGETSMLTDTSAPSTSDVMTSLPTSDVDTVHTDMTRPTSEPMSTTDVWTSADTSGEPLPNLVTNGDFEAGTDGWETWNGGTLTTSTTKARSGLQSALQSGGPATGPVSTKVSPVVAGGTYEVTFWASVGSGTAPVHITRYLSCDTPAYEWVVNDTPVSSEGWTELTGTFTVPESCNSAYVQVYAEGGTAGVDLYIDDVSLVLLSGPDTGSTDTTSDTGATSADVDSGVVDTTIPPDETTDMMPDGGVDASSTEPDTTDVITDPDASVTTDVMTSDVMTTEPVSEGEPIPGDLEVITEFDAATGYVGTFATTDSFESITPTVSGGVAQFSVPFDFVADRFQWVFNVAGAPRNLTGANLVARVRVASGVTNTQAHAAVLQLYGNNGEPDYGGTASYGGLPTDGSWAVVEFDLDTAGYNNYTPAAVTSVAVEFRLNAYDGTVDADVVPGVVEIDWVGLRLPI